MNKKDNNIKDIRYQYKSLLLNHFSNCSKVYNFSGSNNILKYTKYFDLSIFSSRGTARNHQDCQNRDVYVQSTCFHPLVHNPEIQSDTK